MILTSRRFDYENLPEADIVEGFVINAVCLISVLDQLMNGKGGIVRLKE